MKRTLTLEQMQATPPPPQDFLAELGTAQSALFRHCLALAQNREDAAWEILQETNLWLVHHAAEWERRAIVLTWGKRVAENQLHTFLRRKAREAKRFVFLDAISDEFAIYQNKVDNSIAALRHCMRQLKASDRSLIAEHYAKGKTFLQIARECGKSFTAVAVQTKRLRDRLGECIHSALCRLENCKSEIADEFDEESALVFDCIDGVEESAAEEVRGDLTVSSPGLLFRQLEVHILLCLHFRNRRRHLRVLSRIAACAAAFTAVSATFAAMNFTGRIPEEPVAETLYNGKENRQTMKTLNAAIMAAAAASAAQTYTLPAIEPDSRARLEKPVAISTMERSSVPSAAQKLSTRERTISPSKPKTLDTNAAKGTVIMLIG